jgi:hypothetical protein
MSLFKCEACGCIENTALCHYNIRLFDEREDQRALCSECDPAIGKWHGVFPKKPVAGYKLASDGFLYHSNEIKTDNFKWRMEHQGLKVVGDA